MKPNINELNFCWISPCNANINAVKRHKRIRSNLMIRIKHSLEKIKKRMKLNY